MVRQAHRAPRSTRLQLHFQAALPARRPARQAHAGRHVGDCTGAPAQCVHRRTCRGALAYRRTADTHRCRLGCYRGCYRLLQGRLHRRRGTSQAEALAALEQRAGAGASWIPYRTPAPANTCAEPARVAGARGRAHASAHAEQTAEEQGSLEHTSRCSRERRHVCFRLYRGSRTTSYKLVRSQQMPQARGSLCREGAAPSRRRRSHAACTCALRSAPFPWRRRHSLEHYTLAWACRHAHMTTQRSARAGWACEAATRCGPR